MISETRPGTAPFFPAPCDASGFAVFSRGALGRAHVEAHRALDSGRITEGYAQLVGWLGDRPAGESECVHLHWHLLVFEVALGRLAQAQRRLERHLLPAVVFRQACTDAPSALWRLRLAGSEPSSASWQKTALHARVALKRETAPFVILHQLLALAGAGDHRTLRAWIQAGSIVGAPRTYAMGLEALARGDHARAAADLGTAAPALGQCRGGSRAQSALFRQVAEYAEVRALELSPPSVAA